jgi:hypothetical protein
MAGELASGRTKENRMTAPQTFTLSFSAGALLTFAALFWITQ